MDIGIAFLVGVLVGQWIILWAFWLASIRLIELLSDIQKSNKSTSPRSKDICISQDDFLNLDIEVKKIMGRTVPSITLEFQRQQKAFDGFHRALKRSDQLALDELFVSAKKHTAEAAYAAHTLPFEMFLLCMLLEEHKEVMRLQKQIEGIIDF